MLRSNCLKVIICMVLIHMRSPFYFRTQFFIILLIDQSSMEGLTHRLFSNQFMTSPLELSYWLNSNNDWSYTGPLDPLERVFSLIFRTRAVPYSLRSHNVLGIMDDDIVQPPVLIEYCAGCCAWLKPCMDDSSQTLH